MNIPIERKLFKIGSSLAVTLPQYWLKHVELAEGDVVEIVVGEILEIRKPYKLDKDLTGTE